MVLFWNWFRVLSIVDFFSVRTKVPQCVGCIKCRNSKSSSDHQIGTSILKVLKDKCRRCDCLFDQSNSGCQSANWGLASSQYLSTLPTECLLQRNSQRRLSFDGHRGQLSEAAYGLGVTYPRGKSLSQSQQLTIEQAIHRQKRQPGRVMFLSHGNSTMRPCSTSPTTRWPNIWLCYLGLDSTQTSVVSD